VASSNKNEINYELPVE